MRVRHHAQGKFYVIECPEGTRLVRRDEQPAGGEMVLHDFLLVPLNGKQVRIPADPSELLPLPAESGNFGISLAGEPEPDATLVGVSCPECRETDVNWLQLRDDQGMAHCDRCGAEFGLSAPTVDPVTASRRMAD